MYSLFLRKTGQRERSPTTKNYASQTTTICGSGEHQPPRVQWMASARGSLLCDQGIPSARAVEAILPGIPRLKNQLHAYKGTSAGGKKSLSRVDVFSISTKDGTQRERSPTTKNYAPQTTAICGRANISHQECNGWPPLGEGSFVIKAFPVTGKYEHKSKRGNIYLV
ncbi:hypothetical protein TNIN_327301 [Trichonephila inaurata madagascariensis]|uniref:Uncharacterized protein n=1 Tax=Trichonephila inaurata madagascariensis TaxID=2747483 RepID=A0A8X6JLA0_9ARAC|nr:hypothetical protein TNIN_327301 [Trichonephila inaurata madagascariensis]